MGRIFLKKEVHNDVRYRTVLNCKELDAVQIVQELELSTMSKHITIINFLCSKNKKYRAVPYGTVPVLFYFLHFTVLMHGHFYTVRLLDS